jgi:hypothetical protein
LVSVVWLALPAGIARAGSVQVLDQAGIVGRNPSLAIGTDGRGLIAYYDVTNGDLKVAHCNDVPCTSATLSAIDTAGNVGRFPGLAIGADGLGVVSYSDVTNGTLKVAHCDDTACSTAATSTLAPVAVAGRTSVAIGADGLPFIAYVGAAGGPENRVRTLHCANVACTTGQAQAHLIVGGGADLDAAVVVGNDGRPLIAYVPTDLVPAFPPIGLLHCDDAACTSAQAARAPMEPLVGQGHVQGPSLAIAPDGLPRLAFGRDYAGPGVVIQETAFQRCTDAGCQAGALESFPALEATPSLAVAPSGLVLITWARPDQLTLARCTDADCVTFSQTCAPVLAANPSLALGTDSQPLAAVFIPATSDLAVAHGIDEPCGDPTLSLAQPELTVTEGDTSFTALFNLSGPTNATPSVDYATRDGSATAGADYLAASGSLTFGPFPAFVTLTVREDAVDEPDETFYLDIANPANAVLGTATLRVTIVDDDPGQITAGDCETVEGDAGPSACAVPVRLGAPSSTPLTVDFATADGTATAGTDYLAQSGTLTFSPGSVVQAVTVSVIGDLSVELDETFFVNLSNPSSGAVIADGVGTGTIQDDDASSLSSLELTHGSRLRADLAATPGPVADQDLYRLAQGPYSSWEVVVDEVSGDVAPGLLLERLAEDNSTVLQTGVAAGTGPARAMRWQRRAATGEVRHHVRVRSTSCTTDCGPDDSYRLRAYETTGRIPRFNNSGSQVTVLILQNATDQPILANADFWDASGALVHTEATTLGPRAVALVNTATVSALAGTSGSITVTYDGAYGALAGKAVALEPSTGFSFDSPLGYRPR